MSPSNFHTVLTVEQRKEVELWIERALPILRLEGWRIELAHEPPEELTTWASTWPTYGRRTAVLRVNAIVIGEGPDQVLQTLVHELLHLHHGDMLEELEEMLSGAADPGLLRMAKGRMRRIVELMVDELACVIADNVDALPSVEGIMTAPGPSDV